MTRVLVVEDHALVREGLVVALRHLPGVREIKEAADAESALSIVRQDDDLDCILLDLMLPGARGYACLTALRSLRPEVPVVVVSGRDDRDTVAQCLRLGASGFVPKAVDGDELRRAIGMVLAGGVYAPGTPSAETADAGRRSTTGPTTPQLRALTGAQARVLNLLAQGRSNREIGHQLGLAEGTVKIHLTAVYRRLGVANRAQALLMLADPGRARELKRLAATRISGARRSNTPPALPRPDRNDR